MLCEISFSRNSLSLLLFWHKSGGAIREQTTCTARPANASSYLCLICVLVLPNLLSLSVPPNNCKKTNATNRTVKKDYPPQIPSYYSTSNARLVCCQRYFDANWYKKLNRDSSIWSFPQNIPQKYDLHCRWRTCLGRSLGKNVPYGRSNCNYANYCRWPPL